jgi:hypothetical protein
MASQIVSSMPVLVSQASYSIGEEIMKSMCSQFYHSKTSVDNAVRHFMEVREYFKQQKQLSSTVPKTPNN